MKKLITSLALIILCNCSGFAQSSGDLINSRNTPAPMENNTYLGMNLTRIIPGDFELSVLQRIGKHFGFGAALGYDFNFIGNALKSSSIGSITRRYSSIEEEENSSRRYFLGKGIAFRFNAEVLFETFGGTEMFVSVEGLIKKRNYDKLKLGIDGYEFIESADQRIKGLSFLAGVNKKLGSNTLLRFNWGLGIRYLQSELNRPALSEYNQEWPPARFKYHFTAPTVLVGLTLMKKII